MKFCKVSESFIGKYTDGRDFILERVDNFATTIQWLQKKANGRYKDEEAEQEIILEFLKQVNEV